MPVYQYKCQQCNSLVEELRQVSQMDNDLPHCPQCGKEMVRIIAPFCSRGDGFGIRGDEPITLEHINVEGEGPLTFNRKSDLRRYCRKHGLSSGALL